MRSTTEAEAAISPMVMRQMRPKPFIRYEAQGPCSAWGGWDAGSMRAVYPTPPRKGKDGVDAMAIVPDSSSPMPNAKSRNSRTTPARHAFPLFGASALVLPRAGMQAPLGRTMSRPAVIPPYLPPLR